MRRDHQGQMNRTSSDRDIDWNRTEDHFGTGHRYEDEGRRTAGWRSGMQSSDYSRENHLSGNRQYSYDRQQSNQQAHGSPSGHFGKGPKGYKRSDERIREEVCEALYRNESVDASDIEVEVKEAIVTLRGTVDSRETKRAAEYCVEHLSGVEDVRNEISVRRQDSTPTLSSGTQFKNQKLA